MPDQVLEYIAGMSSPEPSVLAEIRQWTVQNTANPEMLSGHPYCNLLYILCKIKKPGTALELGTFTAYSTVAIARALPEHSRLISIEKNEDLKKQIETHIKKAGVSSKVLVFWGEALELIKQLPYEYDFVFIDIGKHQYKEVLELLIPRLKRDALIVIDNTLWEGKVHDPSLRAHDQTAQTVHEFNQWLRNHEKFFSLLLPFRDGVTLAIFNP